MPRVTFYITEELMDRWDKLENKSQFVQDALWELDEVAGGDK